MMARRQTAGGVARSFLAMLLAIVLAAFGAGRRRSSPGRFRRAQERQEQQRRPREHKAPALMAHSRCRDLPHSKGR